MKNRACKIKCKSSGLYFQKGLSSKNKIGNIWSTERHAKSAISRAVKIRLVKEEEIELEYFTNQEELKTKEFSEFHFIHNPSTKELPTFYIHLKERVIVRVIGMCVNNDTKELDFLYVPWDDLNSFNLISGLSSGGVTLMSRNRKKFLELFERYEVSNIELKTTEEQAERNIKAWMSKED